MFLILNWVSQICEFAKLEHKDVLEHGLLLCRVNFLLLPSFQAINRLHMPNHQESYLLTK